LGAPGRKREAYRDQMSVDYIIKPCPFCGSIHIQVDKCTKRVRCKDCFATSGMITKLIQKGVPEEEAPIRAWNTRSYEENN